MNKIVSVIILCYNLEDYISRAIHSCLHQTLSDELYEVIVVDDGSTDKSWNQIQMFDEFECVKMIKNSENLGPSVASNLGIREATGDYIIRVDGDDFINKNLLFTMSEVLTSNDDIGFVYCDYLVVKKEDTDRKLEINTLEKLLNHGAGVMFRRRYLEALGLYDEKYNNCEDYDLLLRYLKNYDGYHLRLPYYRYFKHNGLSSKTEEREILKQKIRRENKC